MKNTKLFQFIIVSLLILSSCSDDNNDGQNENLCGVESGIFLSPPNWIQGTWVDPNNNEEGFKFTANDIFNVSGTNESPFSDLESSAGDSPYLINEVNETEDTYEIYMQLWDKDTCEEQFTFTSDWKWTKIDDNTIRYHSMGSNGSINTYDYIKL